MQPQDVASLCASVSEAKGFALNRRNGSSVAAKEAAAVLNLCTVLASSRRAGGRSCALPVGLLGASGHAQETARLGERKLGKEILHGSLRNRDIFLLASYNALGRI